MLVAMARSTYHHGDLRAALLAEAAALVAERGAAGVSLRELARRAGVSHAAPAHHFTDRRGCSPRWPPRDSADWRRP